MKTKNIVGCTALIVALGGFLMGFDASVISGVNKFIQIEFQLTDIQLGFSVSSLTIIASLAMIISGPLSDKFGRRQILRYSALIFLASAVGSALATNFASFLAFRMLGGIGVGSSLIIAPMYIAEIAPAGNRGRLVSFNQLNIVIGITAAFFSNYLILSLAHSEVEWVRYLGIKEYNWRWMLGIEAVPAIIYFFGLFLVPKSPRWLVAQGQEKLAIDIMKRFSSNQEAKRQIREITISLQKKKEADKPPYLDIFKPAMRLVLAVGITVSVLQQITGINAVFFYAPMIFEQSGIGTNASFIQALLVGITNLIFTVIAMALIDKLGRKPLLIFGVSGIVLFMGILAYGFNSASYKLDKESISKLPVEINTHLSTLDGLDYDNDIDYKKALNAVLGSEKVKIHEGELIKAAINLNPILILVGILGFVACFAMSLGPVMWVLFSELFPSRIRGIAISFVGFINSVISALVQFVFPWELSNLGSSVTFLIYGILALIGLILIIKILPETKGESLEDLEKKLIG